MESWFLESLRGYAIRNQRSLNWFITMESRLSVFNAAAGWLSSSFLFARGRTLFEANSRSWNLPMTKWDKLLAGGYLILKDFSKAGFPLNSLIGQRRIKRKSISTSRHLDRA